MLFGCEISLLDLDRLLDCSGCDTPVFFGAAVAPAGGLSICPFAKLGFSPTSLSNGAPLRISPKSFDCPAVSGVFNSFPSFFVSEFSVLSVPTSVSASGFSMIALALAAGASELSGADTSALTFPSPAFSSSTMCFAFTSVTEDGSWMPLLLTLGSVATLGSVLPSPPALRSGSSLGFLTPLGGPICPLRSTEIKLVRTLEIGRLFSPFKISLPTGDRPRDGGDVSS